MNALTGLFSFEGRAGRPEWWLASIGAAMFGALFVTVFTLAASGGDWSSLASSAAKPLEIVVLNLTVGALVVWIQTAVSVRRSHDRGQSGVGVIAYQLVSYGWRSVATAVVALGLEAPPVPFGGAFLFAFALIGVICAVYFLITLGFLGGEPTANAYGQPARAVHNRNDAAPVLD